MNSVILVAIITLAYGCYTDIKRRKVKALLFVPLVAAAVAQNYFLHFTPVFIIVGVLMFFFTFLEPDTYAYLFVGVIFLSVTFASSFIYSYYWGFQLIVMSLVFLLGFQERLFGIGDIKAIIAVMFATPYYPQLIHMVNPYSYPYPLLPQSLALLTDISISAVLFTVYVVLRILKHGTVKISGIPLAMRYDQKLEKKYPAAFRKHEKNGVDYLIYRTPFLVPIAFGYLFYIIFGFITSIF